MRRIAVLIGSAAGGGGQPRLAAFRQGLEQLGWIEGRNLHTELRWGGYDHDRLKTLAEELVSLVPEVILASPTNALIPMQRATRSIPIVFVSVSDPLGQGIVDSLSRPTGNVTGFSHLEFSMIGKWLQILKEVAPGVTRVATMISTGNAASANWYRTFGTLAPSFAVEPISAPIRDMADIESTIEALACRPNGGLIVPGDTFVAAPEVRRSIVGLTARHRIPALYGLHEFVTEGGLVSIPIGAPPPTSIASSRARRRPICRCSNRRNSSWSST